MRTSLLAILISIGTLSQAQAPIQWIEVGVLVEFPTITAILLETMW